MPPYNTLHLKHLNAQDRLTHMQHSLGQHSLSVYHFICLSVSDTFTPPNRTDWMWIKCKHCFICIQYPVCSVSCDIAVLNKRGFVTLIKETCRFEIIMILVRLSVFSTFHLLKMQGAFTHICSSCLQYKPDIYSYLYTILT